MRASLPGVGPLGRADSWRPPVGPALLRWAGAVVGMGAVLSFLPMLLGLSSTDCGPLDCGLVQLVGKLAACAGVAAAMGALVGRSLAARRYTPAALGVFIMIPALIWGALAWQTWSDAQSGTGEIERLNGAARSYAAAQGLAPAADLRSIALDGKPGWAAVRVSGPTAERVVILRLVGGSWEGRAMATRFGREELRALGAPVDLIR